MQSSIATDLILPLSLAIIMFGMGLSLTIRDFKNVINFPRAAVLGLGNQLLVLPAIGFLLSVIFALPPTLAVGIMIIASCPGGATSNLITHISKGDTALSITLTAISSMVSVFTIPLIVSFALHHFTDNSDLDVSLPILNTIGKIMGITILPVSIGMAVKRARPHFALRMERPVRIASLVIFILVAAGVVIAEKENILPYFQHAGGVVIILNVSTMLIGFFSSRLIRLNLKQTITITIESGVQNAVLAMVIASSILKHPDMAIPAAVYSLFMLFTGGFMMWYFGRRDVSEDDRIAS